MPWKCGQMPPIKRTVKRIIKQKTTPKETKRWWQWQKREKPQELMQEVEKEVEHDPNTDVVIEHFTMWYDRIAKQIRDERMAAGLHTDRLDIKDNGKFMVQGEASMYECQKKYPENCKQLAQCLWDKAIQYLRSAQHRFAYVRQSEGRTASRITNRPFLPEWPSFRLHAREIEQAYEWCFYDTVNRETERYLWKVQMVLNQLIYCPVCAPFDAQIVENKMQRVRKKANEIMEASKSKSLRIGSDLRTRLEDELSLTTHILSEESMIDVTKSYHPMAHEGLW